MQITPHFSWAEMTITEVRSLQVQNRNEAVNRKGDLEALCLLLEDVRQLIGGKPIRIHSGFRCKTLNTKIGGSKKSQHILGQAADFSVSGVDLREIFDLIKGSSLKFGQLILEDGDGDGVPTWIHISLGDPWRPALISQQVLFFDGKSYHPVT